MSGERILMNSIDLQINGNVIDISVVNSKKKHLINSHLNLKIVCGTFYIECTKISRNEETDSFYGRSPGLPTSILMSSLLTDDDIRTIIRGQIAICLNDYAFILKDLLDIKFEQTNIIKRLDSITKIDIVIDIFLDKIKDRIRGKDDEQICD